MHGTLRTHIIIFADRRTDWYDREPGCIYRSSSYGIRIENQ